MARAPVSVLACASVTAYPMLQVQTFRGAATGWVPADRAVLSPDAATRRLWLHRRVRGDRFLYRLAPVAAPPASPSPRRRRVGSVAVPAFAAFAAFAAFGACLAFGVASGRIGARIVAAPSARAAASLAPAFAATATGAGAAFALSVAAIADAGDRRRRRVR